jgi:glycosyltransferase involved in cell wall biosynthesis
VSSPTPPTDEAPADRTAELHELRSVNQRLKVDLARFEDGRYVARHLAWLLVRPACRRGRRLGGRVLRKLGLREAPDLYHEGFRSYKARTAQAVDGNRPRVLHAIANLRTGGSARLVVDLIEHLGGEYEQRVVISEAPRVEAYEGVTVDAFPNLTSARPLRRLLDGFRPDIVHVHYVADQLRTWSDPDYYWYVHVFDAVEKAGLRIIENVNIPTEPYRSDAVDRYVFVSDYVRRRYARPGDATAVVYPGSDLGYFRPGAAPDGAHKALGLVYRLEPDKLNEASLDPIVEALRRREDARAIVVGGGQLLPTYQEVAAKAGVADRVTFTGYVAYEDLPTWYARMSAFVAPVHNESFGHVSVFAMGMELPVAGYNVGALEEMLGGSELLAPPGDAAALADILVGLLDDPGRSQEIGLRNRRRAEENFSVENMVEAYRGMYQELTPAGRPSA